MKRILIISLAISFTFVAVASITFFRENNCPEYVGVAHYQIAPSADLNSIVPIITDLTARCGDTHFVQKRWMGAANASEATKAYRDSLYYKISKTEKGHELSIYSVTDLSWVAADAPVFPGQQYRYPLLEDGFIDNGEGARLVTGWEKWKYGLGLFPAGRHFSKAEQNAAHQALSRPDVKNQNDFKH